MVLSMSESVSKIAVYFFKPSFLLCKLLLPSASLLTLLDDKDFSQLWRKINKPRARGFKVIYIF